MTILGPIIVTLIGQVWVLSLLLEPGRGWNHSTCNTWTESGGKPYKGKQGHGYQGVGQWLLVRPKPRVPALEVRLKRTKKSLLCLKKNGLDISQLPFTQIHSAPFIAWEAGPPRAASYGPLCHSTCGWIWPMGAQDGEPRNRKERDWGCFVPAPPALSPCSHQGLHLLFQGGWLSSQMWLSLALGHCAFSWSREALH